MSGAYVSSTTLAPPVAAEQAVRKLPARGKARFQVSYVRYGDQFVKLNGTDQAQERATAALLWQSGRPSCWLATTLLRIYLTVQAPFPLRGACRAYSWEGSKRKREKTS
jgi:hypothetical protein